MTNEDFLKKNNVKQMNQSEAMVMAGKVIADAIDRQTELQKKNIEIQMKMAGMAGEMFDTMKNSIESLDEGDSWKNKHEDDDNPL